MYDLPLADKADQAQTQVIMAAQNLLETGMPREQVISLLNLTDEQAQQLG